MTRYRTGRHLGRTIYRIELNDPATTREDDQLIGIMDTPELGAYVVEALNARERFLEAERRPVLSDADQEIVQKLIGEEP